MPQMLSSNLLALVLLTTPGQIPDEMLPPNVKEEGFSGAVGAYAIEADAAPRTVRVEDSVILTVRIKSTDPDGNPEHLKLKSGGGPVKLPAEYHPTRRIPALSALKTHFEVEVLPEKDGRPDGDTWEFSYRLRPRSLKANRIPRLEYKYWNPATRTFESSFSSAVDLRVLPRGPVTEAASPSQGGHGLAERYPFQAGPEVLERGKPWEAPGPWAVALFVCLPPALCVMWWRGWRRWHPDAHRLARRRQSRAARVALKALGAIHSTRGERGSEVAAIMTRYLRERLDFPAEEPTPFEAALHLKQAEICPDVAEEVSDLFRACDAARFADDSHAALEDLVGEAARLVRTLEEQPCLCRRG
jgi:hypothetical protein